MMSTRKPLNCAVEGLLSRCSEEQASNFHLVNDGIYKNLSGVSEPYATRASVCYRITTNNVRFIELQFQKRKNILKFFLRTKTGDLSAPKGIELETVPLSHGWGAGVNFRLNPEDIENKKYTIDDVLVLIERSFNACM